MHRPRVLVISFTDQASDPRVDRQIAALLEQYEVTAAGFGPPGHDVEFVDLKTRPLGLVQNGLGVARLLARRFESAYWRHPQNREMLRRLRRVDADVVVANDAVALPIAAELGRPVIFDAHEFAPEEFASWLWWRVLIAPYIDWQCRRYLPRLAGMTSVCEAIGAEYEHAYGVASTVVTNAAPYADLEPQPVSDPIRILHHGIPIPGRGLPEMLRLADLLDDRFTVDFVLAAGSDRFRDGLIAQAAGNPRVRFPDPVPMREITRMANRYDVGLFLLPPNHVNHEHTLPNKFFEFVQGRLAVAIGPSPEMARLVRKYDCGIVAADFDPETLAAELNRLTAADIARFKRASHVAAGELSAERNAPRIQAAVETALGRQTRANAAL